jgi:hypothetical protein
LDYGGENGDSSDAVFHMAFHLRNELVRGTSSLRDNHTQRQLLFLEIFISGSTIVFERFGSEGLMECNYTRRFYTFPSLNVGNRVLVSQFVICCQISLTQEVLSSRLNAYFLPNLLLSALYTHDGYPKRLMDP